MEKGKIAERRRERGMRSGIGERGRRKRVHGAEDEA
jgi:hypothetical protein